MNEIVFKNKFQEIEPEIYSVLENYAGAAYDRKAMMYEKLVSSKVYNRIIWGTTPDDYKQFSKKAITSCKGILLDAGCGGLIQTSDIYLQTKSQCILVDNSSEMLKIAKKRLINLHEKLPVNLNLLQADVFKLPFVDNTFDTVCGFGMIHIFDKKLEYINELLRVLKKGGQFYFSTMTTKRLISKLYMQQLKKIDEFGELYSVNQTLDLFSNEKVTINSYLKGSMLFIVGQKIH
jgi:ubiquinone/menaquinone biosynthesis C-methylase UbiE